MTSTLTLVIYMAVVTWLTRQGGCRVVSARES